MRILVTNDDGINAPGLAILEQIAAQVAGPGGEIWVVAPAFEQSGVGHCISYTHPTLIAQMGPKRFAAEGSPADCVLAGLHEVMADTPPDLILSGVNRGNNAAENTLYSGTIGAALEGALQGYKSIALSQYIGPDNREAPFDCAAAHGAETVTALLNAWPQEAAETDYDLFFNVNFPPCAPEQVQGRKLARQGRRPGVTFSVERVAAPSGRRFLWAKGGAQNVASAPGTDAHVNLEGYISITPMRADLTDHQALGALDEAFT